MKLTSLVKVAGVAAVTTLGLSPARAEIELNKNFSVSGYIAGSATYSDISGGSVSTYGSNSSSTMDMDAMKFAAIGKFAPVTGTLSFWSGSDDNPVFLDAVVSYDMGGGTTVSGGKFLSWLGYEAFDPINMSTYTYGWQSVPGGFSVRGIPAYHSGLRYESSGDTSSFGVAVLDSNNYSTPVYKGDGNLKNGVGLEGYYTYKTKELTSFLGFSYDKDTFSDVDLFGGDWWVQYTAGDATYAGEICYTKFSQPGTDSTDFFAMIFGKWKTSDSVSIVGRLAYGQTKTGSFKPTYTKITVGPNVAITPNLDVIGELSYADFSKTSYDNGWFAVVQGRFKF